MDDKTLYDYCARFGYTVNAAGVIELTPKQAAAQAAAGWMEKSITDPARRCWVVPSDHGTVLIYENVHFIVK